MMIKKYLFVMAVISLFLIAACSSQVVEVDDHVDGVDDVHDDEIEHNDAMPDTEMKVPAPGNDDVEEMVVVTEEPKVMESAKTVDVSIVAKQWSFEPSVVTVKKGDTVKLSVESVDVNHGLAIPDFGVSLRFGAGETVSTEFTADKKGDYSFFCNVPCGRDHGQMRGTLVVE